jgi:hypothetical protein
MNLKTNAVTKFWSEGPAPTVDYRQADAVPLRRFTGTHPQVVQAWLPKADGTFSTRSESHADRARKKTSRHAETGAMVRLPLQQETLPARAMTTTEKVLGDVGDPKMSSPQA